MLRQNYWKLILSAVVVLWAVLELIPLKDQPFGDYVKSEASAKKVQFATLMTKVSDRIAAARAQGRELSTYIALKQIGREEQLDLSEYFPQIRLEDKLKNKEKRNDILLGELLRRSKGSVQLGLDLKGGIAITLEMDPAAASALTCALATCSSLIKSQKYTWGTSLNFDRKHRLSEWGHGLATNCYLSHLRV